MSALFNIPYGLYILTAKTNKHNGCVINTLQQVTSNPNQILISVNKNNHTTNMIQETGKFNVSVLDTSTDFELIKRFGFSSGKDVDKFEGFTNYLISKNGISYIAQHSNSYFCAKVVNQLDVGTHIIFVAEIEDMVVLSNTKTLTYDYYHSNIKPKPEVQNGNKYVCTICGYVHDSNDLPSDFVCPICKHGVEVFKIQSLENNSKKKYVCPVCAYQEESETKIEKCIICGADMKEL